MLEIKRRMNTIKQLGKRENVHQKPLDITQLFKNNNLKNVIKSIFDINMHHNPIKVWVKDGFDAKKMVSHFQGSIFQSNWGISALEITSKVVR
jgi:hypothetical protein